MIHFYRPIPTLYISSSLKKSQVAMGTSSLPSLQLVCGAPEARFMARVQCRTWEEAGDEPTAVQGSLPRAQWKALNRVRVRFRVWLQGPANSVGQVEALAQDLPPLAQASRRNVMVNTRLSCGAIPCQSRAKVTSELTSAW